MARFIAGKLTSTFTLFEIAGGYAALEFIAAVVAALAAGNPASPGADQNHWNPQRAAGCGY